MSIRKEIQIEIEVTQLMVKDLERLWKSYANKALKAKQERELRQDKKGFREYETFGELHDAYGCGYIDDETFYKGKECFEALKKPPELSVIEQHRNRIKELIYREKGTLKELNDELNPPAPKNSESGFEAYDREKQKERLRAMELSDALDFVGQNNVL